MRIDVLYADLTAAERSIILDGPSETRRTLTESVAWMATVAPTLPEDMHQMAGLLVDNSPAWPDA